MLFNSFEYLVFFLAVLLVSWRLVGFARLRIWLLLLASYYFYVSNNHWLILLIVLSTQVDYVAGLAISRSEDARVRYRWLLFSLVINLGILGFFKYFNFFAGTVADLAARVGIGLSWVDLNIALPVGISFYTFQSLSYTIDVYRRRIPAEPSWLRFSFFVSFFPQLIAGPIVRASEFLPQIGLTPRLDADALSESFYRIFLGLFKKIVLADFLALYADAAFNTPGEVDSLRAWIGVYAFAFQIYFDFSGYTDIAIGSARLLGFRLPENFRRPYLALCITDFWRRWHLTLSLWLRDYLFIPLGGSRMPSATGVYRNLMITMVLGGLWHGAAWHFVLWGFLHGLALCVERMTGVYQWVARQGGGLKPWRVALGFLLFQVIVLSWIPFRAENNQLLSDLWGKLMGFETPLYINAGMVGAVLLMVGAWLFQVMDEHYPFQAIWLKLPLWLRAAAYSGVFLLTIIFNSEGAKPFIYFQF